MITDSQTRDTLFLKIYTHSGPRLGPKDTLRSPFVASDEIILIPKSTSTFGLLCFPLLLHTEGPWLGRGTSEPLPRRYEVLQGIPVM